MTNLANSLLATTVRQEWIVMSNKKACHSKWYFQNTPLTLIILITLEFLKMLLLWRMLVVKHTASMEEKCATLITHKRLIKIETEGH